MRITDARLKRVERRLAGRAQPEEFPRWVTFEQRPGKPDLWEVKPVHPSFQFVPPGTYTSAEVDEILASDQRLAALEVIVPLPAGGSGDDHEE